MGLRVSLAASGEQALAMVQQQCFDAILMDIQMPGLDGYQASARIRQNPGLNPPAIPIIAMTANAQTEDRQKALDAGLDDYLSKPINMTRLAAILLRWLKPPTSAPALANTLAPITNPPDQATVALPPQALEAIDMPAALARLGNNRALYWKVLGMFQSGHAQDIEKLRAALRQPDLELARRLAHDLKGLAGTLGADELRAAAKELESACAAGDRPAIEPALARLAAKLTVVLEAIASLTTDSASGYPRDGEKR